MAKKLFRKLMVKPEVILQNRFIRALSSGGLRHPSVWHLNRRSASRGAAIGLFWAMIPMPWQMIPAAINAVYFRSNIAIAVAMVWISNPLTWGPIWYTAYRLGRWILRQPPSSSEHAGFSWLYDQFWNIWQPLFLGSFIFAILAAAAGYVAVDLIWRAVLRRSWNHRRIRLLATSPESI
jgi:uncharacterized protein